MGVFCSPMLPATERIKSRLHALSDAASNGNFGFDLLFRQRGVADFFLALSVQVCAIDVLRNDAFKPYLAGLRSEARAIAVEGTDHAQSRSKRYWLARQCCVDWMGNGELNPSFVRICSNFNKSFHRRRNWVSFRSRYTSKNCPISALTLIAR
jgi:hypothetical protein